jgi:hypothetical protein
MPLHTCWQERLRAWIIAGGIVLALCAFGG